MRVVRGANETPETPETAGGASVKTPVLHHGDLKRGTMFARAGMTPVTSDNVVQETLLRCHSTVFVRCVPMVGRSSARIVNEGISEHLALLALPASRKSRVACAHRISNPTCESGWFFLNLLGGKTTLLTR